MTGMTGTESKVQSTDSVGAGAEVKLAEQGRKRGPRESGKAKQNEDPLPGKGKAARASALSSRAGFSTGAPSGTDLWGRTRTCPSG